MNDTERRKFIKTLSNMPDWELAETLEEVFANREPFPDERRYMQSRFFFGIATSHLEDDSGEWLPYQITAVAYPDRERYTHGIKSHLDQEGKCSSCQIILLSCAKDALCPICFKKCYLT